MGIVVVAFEAVRGEVIAPPATITGDATMRSAANVYSRLSWLFAQRNST
jgi:hypothetical protein